VELKIKNSSYKKLKTTIYNADSPLANPIKIIGDIFHDICKSRELIIILFFRDLKGAYRQSFLGYLWIIMPPIATTLAWFYMTSQNLINVGKTPIPYPAFVMTGQIIWGVFSSSFNAPQAGFNNGSQVFMKLKVPPEAFIINALANIVFDLALKSLLIVAVFIIFWSELVLSWTILLVPFGLLTAMLFGASFGLLLVPLGSLYTDIGRIIGMGMPFLMYTTPVIFPLAEGDGFASMIMRWNPLCPVIEVTRSWLTLGTADIVFVQQLFILIPISLVISLIGLILLRVAMPHLIVRLGM
jgi:lipopolysaccharide transport system permease protein